MMPTSYKIYFGFLLQLAGVPVPTVRWLYGGRSLPSNTSIQSSKGDLLMQQSRPSYAGTYTCQGKNTEGIVEIKFYVNVIKDNARVIILKTGKCKSSVIKICHQIFV